MAATASKSGKTSASIALICALRKRGFDVLAAKFGPDYIDRSWLALASGKAALNLDLWMAGMPDGINWLDQLLQTGNAASRKQLLIIEGAMGLYDGKREGGNSTAHMACQLQLPVCLLLNIDGMGQSCAALAQGFLDFEPPLPDHRPCFLGVICTHSGSASHEKLAANALAPILSRHALPLLGFLPKKGAPALPARHLGLVQAEESKLDFAEFGGWFERNCDLDAILARLKACFPAFETYVNERTDNIIPTENRESKKDGCFCRAGHGKTSVSHAKPVVLIAHDAAFSFIYADFPALLRALGAEVRYFSPLHDETVPECDAIYFPGGYPEVFARQLSANRRLHEKLQELALKKTPIYAECGGYIFLGKELRLENGSYAMTGLLPCSFEIADRLQSLGYREAYLMQKPDIAIRGHEFHYGRIRGDEPKNLWQMRNGRNAMEGYRQGIIWASWLHLYPAGSISFWKYWLELARVKKHE